MSKIAAFFDVDETLIKIKSMFHFYQFWCYQKKRQDEYNSFNKQFINAISKGTEREELNRMYYRQLKGVHIDELYQAGEYWFNKHLQKDEIYIQSAINEYFNHKKLEHLTIFVSGSMLPLLKPLGKYLDVDFILCTKLLLDKEDRLTGEIGEPQTIGNGKKESIIKFSYKNNINLKNSFAYGDDISDIQMLESTGNPICIGNNKELIKHAEINNWKTII